MHTVPTLKSIVSSQVAACCHSNWYSAGVNLVSSQVADPSLSMLSQKGPGFPSRGILLRRIVFRFSREWVERRYHLRCSHCTASGNIDSVLSMCSLKIVKFVLLGMR